MRASSPRNGKIVEHDHGLGVPSPEDVARRAAELARIAGRSQVTETDIHHARNELLGRNGAGQPEEALEMTNRDEVPGSSGHHVENHGPEDESTMAEELTEQGLDEALHDEMVEAHKMNIERAS